MTKVSDHRRENLRRLIDDHDGPTALAKKLGYSNGSFLVQMAGPTPTRDVTERTARKIEEKLKLPAGALDEPPVPRVPTSKAVPTIARAVAATPAVGSDTAQVGEVVRLVSQVLQAETVPMPPAEKFALIVQMAYEDTLEHAGKPREDHIRSLIRLIK